MIKVTIIKRKSRAADKKGIKSLLYLSFSPALFNPITMKTIRFEAMGLDKPERSILGVSLSGLFAIWASLSMSLFRTVGSVSGSLWYDGFLEWIKEHTDTVTERYYFSLGDKEKDGKNKRLASVEEATLEAVDLLKSVGKEVNFEYNEGNHFGPLMERIEKAINGIYTESI